MSIHRQTDGHRPIVVADRVADDGDAVGTLTGDDPMVPVAKRAKPADVVSALEHRRFGDALEVVLGLAACGRQLLTADETLDNRYEAQLVHVRHLHIVVYSTFVDGIKNLQNMLSSSKNIFKRKTRLNTSINVRVR